MSAATLSPNKVLDCSGLLCPLPVIKTSKAIKEIEVGQVLKMIATDPGAPPDMQAWTRQTGHEMIDSHQEDGKFIFYFRRAK
jgi:tRNA 2-thiouridine synthesizing protein A